MGPVFDLVQLELEEDLITLGRAIFQLQLCTNEETSYLIPQLRRIRKDTVERIQTLIERGRSLPPK